MASSHPDQQKYERALQRYFQVPALERTTREREKILKVLGLENPQEFLGMHIPLWEAKVDELLDPTNTDMVPISISHFYVNWVRGAIRMMPAGARVKILTAKLKATGLKKAVLTLLHVQTGEAYRDFEVTDVLLVQKIHKDTLFSVRTPDRKGHTFYLSHFGCLGEYIYGGLPGLVGLSAIPVVYHVTPQGEEVLLKPREQGTNIFLDEGVTTARILRDGGWWVDGAARQDALGDCLGTALRYGHYVATPKKEVVMIDNIELFHMGETDVRIFEPIYEFLPRTAYPGDSNKRDDLQRKMRVDYEKSYAAQMDVIRKKWPEIERYLNEMHRHIHAYNSEPFEKVVARVKARVSGERWGG
jgi:hypothetical protein